MVQIRGIEIGSGRPKICVPITGATSEEIQNQAKRIASVPAEIVEWRTDYAEFVFDEVKVMQCLSNLRKTLQNKILLFTFRSKNEGGEKSITEEDYMNLNLLAANSKLVDLIDVELYFSENLLKQHITDLQNAGCKVILSNHDFVKTPEESEIVDRLSRMEKAGADIAKMAVMPNTPKDVITLLSATCEAKEKLATPIVTMSMGKLGAVSRLTGQVFGSAITFGMVGDASAPGQVPVEQLNEYLNFFS